MKFVKTFAVNLTKKLSSC